MVASATVSAVTARWRRSASRAAAFRAALAICATRPASPRCLSLASSPGSPPLDVVEHLPAARQRAGARARPWCREPVPRQLDQLINRHPGLFQPAVVTGEGEDAARIPGQQQYAVARRVVPDARDA